MDQLLRDIRNFLWKLESGQLEIEAGQWELHRDIDNMKNSFRQLLKLKENVEDMKVSNERQLGIIRELEAKLELYKNQRGERKNAESEITVENCGENSRCSYGGSSVICIQGCNTRKPRAIRSEKIPGIMSTMNTSTTRKTISALEKKEVKEGSEGCSAAFVPRSCCYAAPISQPKSLCGSRNINNSMLQRYLKDSAKYCDNISTTTCDIYGNPPPSKRSCYSAETDESFAVRGPRSSCARTPPAHRSSENGRTVRSDSLHKFRSADSVVPKEMECRKYPKKFMLEIDVAKHDRHGHTAGKPNHFCVVCRQVFETKDLLKTHKEVHCKASRRSNVYECNYCDTACGSPTSLSLHSRNCKLIRRSRRKK